MKRQTHAVMFFVSAGIAIVFVLISVIIVSSYDVCSLVIGSIGLMFMILSYFFLLFFVRHKKEKDRARRFQEEEKFE